MLNTYLKNKNLNRYKRKYILLSFIYKTFQKIYFIFFKNNVILKKNEEIMSEKIYSGSYVSTNKVLKNSFIGLGVELSVYTLALFIGMSMGITGLAAPLILWGISFVLLMVLPKFSDSLLGFGLANIVALLLGLSSSPALAYYIGAGFTDEILMSAITTAIITFSLSFYANYTKKDFSYLGGALFAIVIGMIIISLLNIFIFQNSLLSLGLSFLGVVVFSLYILFDVSMIVTEKEGNWIMGSVSLFLSVINLFWSILRILSAFSDD